MPETVEIGRIKERDAEFPVALDRPQGDRIIGLPPSDRYASGRRRPPDRPCPEADDAHTERRRTERPVFHAGDSLSSRSLLVHDPRVEEMLRHPIDEPRGLG